MIDHLFIYNIPSNAVSGQYNWSLVVLSYVIVVASSFIAISMLTYYVKDKPASKHKASLLGGFFLGGGIWSMHFTGMLAYEMDMVHNYSISLTIISLLIAIIFCWLALEQVLQKQTSRQMVLLSAFVIGIAIVSMHYIGMASMEMDADLRYLPIPFAASVIIAIVVAALAIPIIRQCIDRKKVSMALLASVVMGVAVCGMHYIGMEASVFLPYAECRFVPGQNHVELAFIVAFITLAFIIAPGFVIILNRLVYQKRYEENVQHKPHWNYLYITSFAFIALIITISTLFLSQVTKGKDSAITLINISGKQRMLSQRTAFFANELVIASQDERPHVRQLLAEATNEMESSHHDLIEGNAARNLPPLISQKVRVIYFEKPDELDKKMHVYIKHLRSLHAAPDHLLTPDNADLYAIDHTDAMDILPILDKVAQTHQSEAHKNATISEYAQQAVFLLILSTLGLICLFVFRPMMLAIDEKTIKLAQYSEKLKAAKEKAEEATRLKSHFLANMSHELRTPLHGMGSFAQYGIREYATANRKELLKYFECILSCNKRLTSLVDNILTSAKMEYKTQEFNFQQDEIQKPLQTTISEVSPLLDEKKIELIFQPPRFSTIAIIDSEKLVRVFTNVLGNAIKFSAPNTQITITMEQTTLDNTKEALSIAISDEGVGIPEEELQSIFESFVQSTRTKTNAGGTGLGLNIVNEIIKAHQGRINAHNNPGRGTTFTITIPVALNIGNKLYSTKKQIHTKVELKNADPCHDQDKEAA